jgi:hypothetical protein
MAYVVFHNQLSFQPVDREGVPTGPEEVVMKGGEVPEYVPPFVVSALRNAGMIVDAGDRDRDAIRALIGADYGIREGRALPNPEQPMGADGSPPLFSLSGDPADHEYPQVTTAEAQGQPFLTSDEGSTVVDDGSGEQTGEGQGETQSDGEQAEPAQLEKPGMRDSKAAWEDYAEQIGVDRSEAESMNKAELISTIESRESQ